MRGEGVGSQRRCFCTLVSVGHEDAGHEFVLAVGTERVPDHDLLFSQLTLQLQAILPVELYLGWRGGSGSQHD